MIEPQLDALNLTIYPNNERFNLTDMTGEYYILTFDVKLYGETCTSTFDVKLYDEDNLDVGLHRTYFDYTYDNNTQTYLEVEESEEIWHINSMGDIVDNGEDNPVSVRFVPEEIPMIQLNQQQQIQQMIQILPS